MPDVELIDTLIKWSVGIPAVGVIIAQGISMIRRRASADSKALYEDKSHSSLIESYKIERDEIRVEKEKIMARLIIVETERNEAVGKVGKLTAEVEFLSSQVSDLKVLVEKLGTSLEIARTEISKFAIENAKLSAQVTYLEELVKQAKP
jgi:chromosome segregation ATPase